jgi:replicative DNA helicase
MNPRNNDERALLGCAILDPTVIDQFGARIAAADWWRPQHAALWHRLRELRDDARHANAAPGAWIAVVLSEAYAWGADVDGAGYDAALPNATPSPEAAPYYVAKVTKAALRSAATLLLRDTLDSLDSGADPDQALAILDSRAAALTHRDAIDRPDWVRIGQTAAELYEITAAMQRDPAAAARLVARSPWPGLDARIGGGFRPGQITILAGRPATGKTAAAMQIAAHVAAGGRGVGVFSLEMARADLTLREFARHGAIRLHGLLHADLTAQEWRGMARALETMGTLPMWVDDTPALHIVELRRRARKLGSIAEGAGHPLGLLVVDYLQLAVAKAGRHESREQEVATISRGLLAIAKELRVAVVALAQMNRGIESRADPKPRMADLRESGQIEQDAQNVIFTHHDDDDPDPDARVLVVAKARAGQAGDVPMRWTGEHQRLDEVDGRHQAADRPRPREVSRWREDD